MYGGGMGGVPGAPVATGVVRIGAAVATGGVPGAGATTGGNAAAGPLVGSEVTALTSGASAIAKATLPLALGGVFLGRRRGGGGGFANVCLAGGLGTSPIGGAIILGGGRVDIPVIAFAGTVAAL